MIESNKKEISAYISLAHERLAAAYAPYSQFQVSAVLVMKDGTVTTGVNIENVSFGATVCAERVAIFEAVNKGYRRHDFEALIIIAHTEDTIKPCSLCRQVFVEFFTPKLKVYLANEDKAYEVVTVEQLVPYAFSQM